MIIKALQITTIIYISVWLMRNAMRLETAKKDKDLHGMVYSGIKVIVAVIALAFFH
jgi:hypothetical protein